MSISFISLVPDEIKTSALTGDTGYDTYLRDAHRQVLLYPKKQNKIILFTTIAVTE